MGSSMILESMTRKMFMFLLCCMFSRGNSQVDQTQTGTPSTGMLCISECGTCPLLCSPPPSPQTATIVPPPQHYTPPETYYFDTPPPAPKASTSHPPPKASTSHPQSPPPPAYMVYSGMPPPPSNNINNNPSMQFPPGLVPQNNQYPYYYSVSQASIPQQGVSVFISLLVFQALYYLTVHIGL